MKKAIPKVPLIYPLPVGILGFKDENGIMYTTVKHLSVMGSNPPQIGVLLEEKHPLRDKITEDTRFSLSFPSTPLIDKVDLCASYDDLKKLDSTEELFNTAYDKSTIPYLDDAPVALINKVNQVVEVKKKLFVIADVQKTLVDEEVFVDDHIPSMNILDPIVFGLDEKYYTIGQVIGRAEIEGKELYRSMKKLQKPKPYSFYFKLKMCQMKDRGVSYTELSNNYGVYHETIEDWYILYSLFGREGLSKKMSNRLANTKFSEEKRQAMVEAIIEGKKTYRETVQDELVSLSRLRNWVKKERRIRRKEGKES